MTTLEFYPVDDVEPDTKQSYPGSFAQQRLWILSQMDRSIDAYVITRTLRLRGPLDLPALTATLDGIMARHEMLRTHFEMHDGALRQIVEAHISAPLTQSDVSGTADPEAACRALLREDLAIPFALSRAPLWRVRLCKLGDGDWVLALIVHHIIADAWSMELLQQELALRYQAHVSGAELALPAPRRNYGDYAAWQRSPAACEAMEEARNYWMEKLADPELLELPADMPGPRRMLAPAATLRHAFDPIQVQALKMLATDRSSSLFMALTALVKTLLYRYCGQRDITVGTPIAGRDRPELETVVGLFINVVALRDRIEPGDGFTTLLDQVARTAYEAFAHQNYSLEHLIDDLDLERDAARAPLFDVLVALQNVPAASSRVADLQIGPFEAGPEAAKYDLIFEFAEDGDGLILNLIYSTGLFSAEAMTRLCSHLERLLEGLLSAPEAPVGTLPLLTRAERAELAGWAGGASPYPREASLTDLFGEIVAATPDAPALRFGETTLSYAQLDDRAGKLAAYIDAQYAPEGGAVIGLCLERGIDLVIAMLAVLKTGGAYLPLDPDLPAERLGYMIGEAKVGLVLSQQALEHALPEGSYAQLLIDRDAAEIAACEASVPTGRSNSGSLAYVMYTSGSTGRPKGVMVPQRAVTRLVRDTDYVDIRPGDRIAQAATPAFDAATFEIWGALLNGAAIELLHRDDVLDPDRFADLLREERFNTMFLTASLFNRMVQLDASLFSGLETLLVGGEALDPGSIRAVLEAGPPRRLLNGYGPTECTTFAVCHHITEVAENAAAIPIGSPIANTVAHILDPDGQPVPAGIPGELHLGGDGLANGYLDQPELTNQRFIEHPTLGRLYKTGDLCRWNRDLSRGGAIDYLGRTDHQIKLRGFRIELGEIEATLRAQESVEEAVAILAGEGEHRRIVAYVTGGADGATLRRDLHAVLPSYMVPSEIIVLDALPLTVTGKLDRRALPEPAGLEQTASGAPATPGEELLAGLWASVLKRDAVGRADSFFDLGGHSLLATQLLSRIRAAFNTDIALRLLFEHPTLAAQAAAIEAERRGTPPPPIVPRENRDTLPLSFAQQRLWFLAQLEGSAPGATYNVTAALGLDGALDEAALRSALVRLTARHESLRMAIHTEAGHPVLRLRDAYDPLIVEDLAVAEGEDRDAVLRARAAAHAAAPFDLATEPLLRLTLLRLDEDQQVLLVNLHHIAADGWSLGVLVRDLSALYAAALEEREADLPPLPVQYADYAAWQRDWLSGAVLDAQIAYWRDRLDTAPALLELPADRPRSAIKTYRGGHLTLTLAPELTDRLEAFSRAKGVTLFMALLAGFKTLLHRYSGAEDILVGSPIANRTHAQTEELVGFFVNTLVLRSTVTRDTSFEALLSRVRETALDAYAHQDLPFETLVNALQPERSLSHSPLFQVMFALQNAPQEELHLGDATIQTLAPDLGTAKFDLTLSIEAGPQGLTCNWEYAGDLFDPSRIDRMAAHYGTLLESLLAAPEASVGTLPLLTDAEQAELANWAGGDSPYPRDASLADLFAEMVQASPDAPALRFGEVALTYAELDDRSSRLAAYIDAQYAPEGCAVIGLCLERGIDLVIAMLAILKTGGAYLPLDPDLPAERLGYMIGEAKVGLVLSQQALAEALPEGGYAQLLIDRDAAEIAACDAPVPAGRSDGGSLAYVMYTSGSTGRPKGVMVPQRAVTRLVRDTDYVDIKPGDRIAQAATPAFDAATFEIWGALLNGAAVELLDRDDVLDPDRFADLLRQKRFNTMFLTTALFNRLAQIDPALFGSLDTLLFGGEAVDPRWVRAVLKAGPPKRLLHVYGPTECTTYATAHLVEEVPDTAVTVPIGLPIANTVAHILDPDGQPVPAGIPGELHLGGDGLANGYLDQPELTNQRFIQHPTLGRLYKTGDLCRWNRDLSRGGAIDYLGRTDHQIKLRGFRIELGEIEATLRAQDSVEEAVVILHEAGDRRQLVAYASRTADAGSSDTLGDILQAHMVAALPDYMVPAQTIVLDAMPLNANGKIDRRALPDPTDTPVRDAYEEPRTEREIALALVWCSVLGRARIGRHDNFFELGGDSILSIQIVAQARAAGLRLAVRDLFEHQTIAALAPHAATDGLANAVPAMPRGTGPVPLTPVQSWFFSWDLADKTHFNQALLLRPRDRISVPELEAAGRAILDRHAALRLRFGKDTGGWHQECAGVTDDLPVHHEDLRDLPPETQTAALTERASHWQGSLDPERGPVMRLVLFELTEGQRLFWCIHHLAVDGVSWRILLGDLERAFAQIHRGAEITLAPASASFLDWAHYLQTLAASPEIAEEAAYWRDWEALPPLPKDTPGGTARWDSTAHVKLALDRETTTALLEQAPRAFSSRINDLLLTALAIALEDWTGRSDWPIALESHGRPERPGAPDTSETVGWFTAITPVRLELPDRSDLATCLKAVKEQLRAIPGEGLAHGIGRYLTDSDPEAYPEPEIAFNYLGQFEQATDGSFFTVANENTGESQCLDGTRPHTIDINGLVSDGALNLSLSYGSGQYRRETMERLAAGVENTLRALVELCGDEAACGYTPSDFPLTRVSQDQLDLLAAEQGRGIAALYPLSPMQLGLAYHSLSDAPGGSVYFEQLTWKIDAPFDPESFHAAWDALVERHQILRTALWLDGDQPLQFVRRAVVLPWRELDWREMDEAAREDALEKLLAEERSAGFDLTQPPLLRCVLIRMDNVRWQFVLGFHHLLLDGWSLPILFRDLMLLYGSRATDLPAAAPYERYIAWLERQDHTAAHTHWRTALAGFDAPTPLPCARSKAPEAASAPQQEAGFTFEPTLGKALIETARERHLTLSTLFNAAWALVLSRTSGEREVTFGVTLSGRDIDLAGIEDMVGLFINTVPMCVSIADCPTGPWLEALQVQHQQNSQFGYVPLAEIQRDSETAPGTALFDSLLVFENYPLDPHLPGGEGASAHFSEGRAIDHTNYPLTLIAAAYGDEIRLRVGYDGERFDVDGIARIVAFLTTALRGLIDAETKEPLDRIEIIDGTERAALWNAGRAQCRLPVTDTLITRFASQVVQHPDRPAVTCSGTTLSYAALDARAETIARCLRALGAGPDRLVGLLADRSVDLIAGLLGIVKSGAAYLPIDPATPAARVAFMLKDAEAIALVTERTHEASLDLPCLYLDDQAEENATPPAPDEASMPDPDHMAYVIYTSGSTGQPKGVMVSHANVLRLFDATAPDCAFSAKDVWTMFHSVAFDFSVWEIWGALLHGGRVVVVPDDVRRTPAAFHDLLESEGVTILNQTPSAFRHLIPEAVERGRALALRMVVFGGEALDLPGLKPWFGLYGEGQPRLVNMYGITETTVHVTWCPLHEGDCTSTASLIGLPLRDLDLHLLDDRGEPVPDGVTGEIHVGGAGLARGYLNRPALTAERFIDCMQDGTSERLYRSGDLARRRPDGGLEYLGRIDKQVKLRGYRIEIGEIEATLSQHPAVHQVAVIAQQDQGRLVAYVVCGADAIPELRDWVAERLPGYMVPALFVPLERIPLTRNGKTDHQALPKPDAHATPESSRMAPRTDIERRLLETWQEVLGVGVIGIDDDFFTLGGHSLKALQVVSRTNRDFGVKLPVALLLKHPTIAALAPFLSTHGTSGYEPVRPAPEQETYPLSHAQKRFWLEDRLATDARYNMPAAFELQGTIDAEALHRALERLIARHETLRTIFVEIDGEPRQRILVSIDVPLKSIALMDSEDADSRTRAIIAEENRTRFALEAAPLFRVTLITRDSGPTVFVLVMHHIIGDGWSMEIFYRELLTLYRAARDGTPNPLPPLTIQYRDYAVSQDRRDRSEDARYWAAQLDGLHGPLRLPHDLSGNPGAVAHGNRVRLLLPEESSTALRTLSHEKGTTPANTLLALFKLFLFQLTRQEDICVGMAAANRGRPELEPLLGAFVNLLPLRTRITPDLEFGDLLDRVTRTSADALDHQDYPYDLILRGRGPAADGRDPVNIIYAYQNASGEAGGMPNGPQEGPDAKPIDLIFPFAKVDLMLLVEDLGSAFALTLEYDSGLFTVEAAERHLQSLNRFADAIAADMADVA